MLVIWRWMHRHDPPVRLDILQSAQEFWMLWKFWSRFNSSPLFPVPWSLSHSQFVSRLPFVLKTIFAHSFKTRNAGVGKKGTSLHANRTDVLISSSRYSAQDYTIQPVIVWSHVNIFKCQAGVFSYDNDEWRLNFPLVFDATDVTVPFLRQSHASRNLLVSNTAGGHFSLSARLYCSLPRAVHSIWIIYT